MPGHDALVKELQGGILEAGCGRLSQLQLAVSPSPADLGALVLLGLGTGVGLACQLSGLGRTGQEPGTGIRDSGHIQSLGGLGKHHRAWLVVGFLWPKKLRRKLRVGWCHLLLRGVHVAGAPSVLWGPGRAPPKARGNAKLPHTGNSRLDLCLTEQPRKLLRRGAALGTRLSKQLSEI